MGRRAEFAALIVLLACAECGLGQKVSPDGQKASFTMSISLKESTVKPGSEVQVAVELTNTSTERIWLWRSRSGPPPYTIKLLDREGKGAAVTAKGRAFQKGEAIIRENGRVVRAFPGGGEQVSAAPGETVKDWVSVDDQFDLTQPGIYTIQLERVDLITKLLVKSNALTFTVAD